MRLLLALLIACAPQRPLVVVRASADVADVQQGLAAWRSLGFATAVNADATLPRCERNWRANPDCAIRILLHRAAGVGGVADRNTRTITISTAATGRQLQHLVAHEVGHILLDTGEHSATGVMSGTDAVRLTHGDRVIACRAINRGCP